jgi:hypothetical protein
VAVKLPDPGEGGDGERRFIYGRSWLAALRDLPAAFAAAGLLLYGVLYMVYANFYGSFGLLPEEVGLGYANIFVRSLGLLTAITACALMLRLAFIMYIFRSNQHGNSRIRRAIVAFFRAGSFLLPLLFVVLWLASLFSLTDTYAFGLRVGLNLRPARLGPLTVLDIGATPVRLIWGNDASPQQKRLMIDHLLYLGRNEGVVVVYDYSTQSVLRLPSGSVTIIALPCRQRCAPPDKVAMSGFDLQGADLHRAHLGQADLQGTNLQGANLQEALLIEANLRNANLRGADLRGALLGLADLRGADLQGVKFDEVTFVKSHADSKTIWPKGFDPRSGHVDLRK